MFLFIHRNFITGIFMSNFNYNTVIPQYNTNLYSGNYVPTNSDWLLSPAQNTVTSPVQGDSFTSSSKGNDGKFDYSIDDGKISFGDKLKNFGKGLISPITNMFSSPKNFLIGVGMVAAGAALMIGTAGAAAPILVALGVTAGAVQLGTGAYKAATAKTDAEAEAAWQGIGAGTTSVGLSVLGAKSSLKAAGFADDAANMNMLQATAKCFKVAPGQFGKSVANAKLTLGIKPKTTSPKTEPKSVDTMESKVEPKAEPKTEPKPAEKPKSAEQTQSAEQPSAAKEKSITKQEHAQKPAEAPKTPVIESANQYSESQIGDKAYIEKYKIGEVPLTDKNTGKTVQAVVTNQEGSYRVFVNGMEQGSMNGGNLKGLAYGSSGDYYPLGNQSRVSGFLVSDLENTGNYKGVGTELMKIAAQESIKAGHKGRLGLCASTIDVAKGSPIPFYEKMGLKMFEPPKIEGQYYGSNFMEQMSRMYLPEENVATLLAK